MKTLFTVTETIKLIESKKNLVLAADESLLLQLPKGNWIGGTIPYFMSENGGLFSKELIQVFTFPDFVSLANTKFYSEKDLAEIPNDYPENGFSFILIPSGSKTHLSYAENCSAWRGFYDRPILGWITGVDLKEIGSKKAKVFNGTNLEQSDQEALVMHLILPENRFSQINILNLFSQGTGDEISFNSTGFEIQDCLINGKELNFSDYLQEIKADIQLPLVANYNGAMINASFQNIDSKEKKVLMYAPVFKGIKYKIAAPLKNYADQFATEVNKHKVTPDFSCNCILNYMYADLTGKKTGEIKGPMTFGEIAYILLNQTIVYMTFETK